MAITSGVALGSMFGNADEPARIRPASSAAQRTNRLQIIVASVNGAPVADADVAMARLVDGTINVRNREEISCYGPPASFMYFFHLRNCNTALVGHTDLEGRVCLSEFAGTGDRYNILAYHYDAGIALVTDVVPAKHQDAPFRITLAPPGYVRVPSFETMDDFPAITHHVWCTLADDTPSSAAMPGAADGAPWNVRFAHEFQQLGNHRRCAVPGGHRYWVNHHVFLPNAREWSLMLSRYVDVAPGETFDVERSTRDGAVVRGIVADRQGRGLSRVSVVASSDDGTGLSVGAVSDKKGAFELRGVPRGSYSVELTRWPARDAVAGWIGSPDIGCSRGLAIAWDASDVELNLPNVDLLKAYVGNTVPDIDLRTIDRRDIRLSHQRGKVCVLVIWPSIEYASEWLDDLNELVEEFGEERLTIIGVPFDRSREKVAEFVATRHI